MFSHNRLKSINFYTNKVYFPEESGHFLKVLFDISVCLESIHFWIGLYGSFSKCVLVFCEWLWEVVCWCLCVRDSVALSWSGPGGWRKGMLRLHVACNLVSSNQSKNNNTGEELRQMCVCVRVFWGKSWVRSEAVRGEEKRCGMKTWRNLWGEKDKTYCGGADNFGQVL